MANNTINPSDNVSITLDTNLAMIKDFTQGDKDTAPLIHKSYFNIDDVVRKYEKVIKSVTGQTAKKLKTLSEYGERIISYSVPAELEEELRTRIEQMEKLDRETFNVIGQTSILTEGSSPVYNAVFNRTLKGSKAFTSAQATAHSLHGTAVRTGTGNSVRFNIPITEEDYNAYMSGKGTIGNQIFKQYFGEAQQLSKRETSLERKRERDSAEKQAEKEEAKANKEQEKEKSKETQQHRKSMLKTFGVVAATLTLVANTLQKIYNSLINFAKDTVKGVNTTGGTGLDTNTIRMLNNFDKAMGFGEGTGTGIIAGLNKGFINVDRIDTSKLENIAKATGSTGAKLAMKIRTGKVSAVDLMQLVMNTAQEQSSKGLSPLGEPSDKADVAWYNYLEDIQGGLGQYWGRMWSDSKSNSSIKTAQDWFNSAQTAYNPAGITTEIQTATDQYAKALLLTVTGLQALADALKGQWIDNLQRFLQNISESPLAQRLTSAETKLMNYQSNMNRISAAYTLGKTADTRGIINFSNRLKSKSKWQSENMGDIFDYILKKGTLKGYGGLESNGLTEASQLLATAAKEGNLIPLLTNYARIQLANEAEEALRKGETFLAPGVNPEAVAKERVAKVILNISSGMTSNSVSDSFVTAAIVNAYADRGILSGFIDSNPMTTDTAQKALNWIKYKADDKTINKLKKGKLNGIEYTERSTIWKGADDLEREFLTDLYNSGIFGDDKLVEMLRSGNLKGFLSSVSDIQARSVISNMRNDTDLWSNIMNYLFVHSPLATESGLFGENALHGTADINITVKNDTDREFMFTATANGNASGAVTNGSLDVNGIQLQPKTAK